MTLTFLLTLAIGGAGGFYVGRWWAEDSRARSDMERTWDGRQNYRKK